MLIRNKKTGIDYECNKEEWDNLVKRQAHFRFKVLKQDENIIDEVKIPIEVDQIVVGGLFQKYNAITKANLIQIAEERGLKISRNMRKAVIIDLIIDNEGN